MTISYETDKNVIEVYYALDTNKDEVPDKYQVKVTYSAENGTIDTEHNGKTYYVLSLIHISEPTRP